jgi:hypothetical protein
MERARDIASPRQMLSKHWRKANINAAELASPNPSIWVMMILGLAGLGFTAYRSTSRLARVSKTQLFHNIGCVNTGA